MEATGTTIEFVNEDRVLIPPLRGEEGSGAPLIAITDACSSAMCLKMVSALNSAGVHGEEDEPGVTIGDGHAEETFRKSKKAPGTFQSTIKKSHHVPPVVGFCCGCHNIVSKNVMKRCSRCMGPVYCSRDCQKVHWCGGNHQSECVCKDKA